MRADELYAKNDVLAVNSADKVRSAVFVPSDGIITNLSDLHAILKSLQGRIFVNKTTGIKARLGEEVDALLSNQTKGKSGTWHMSVVNLTRLGYSVEDAKVIHMTAVSRIHELFEKAEDVFLSLIIKTHYTVRVHIICSELLI